MNTSIDAILQDLYAVDAKLRGHEEQLRPLIAKLLAAKPDTKFDAYFAKALRRQLVAVAATQSQPSFFTRMQTLVDSKWAYSLGGALTALVLMVPVVYFSLQGAPSRDLASALRDVAERSVQSRGSQAFGSLASLAETTSRSQSGGGGAGSSNPVSDKVDSRMIVPPFQQPYRFVYGGEPIQLNDAQLEVFKRIKDMGDTSSVARSLFGLGGGLIDLSSFGSSSVRTVEFFQDIDEGYSFGVNFTEGTIYVNAVYERWFTDSFNCGRGDCPQPPSLSIGDMPSDSELLAIAQSFVTQHGINVSSYGQPFADQNWRIAYEANKDKEYSYVPDVVDVIYPLVINDQEVRDNSGYPYGLRVQINVRVKKVYGIWGLTTQRYESAQYAAEQDANRIVKLAEQGGLYGFWGEPAPDAREIKLGTPTRVLMQHYLYVAGTNEELYVPALVFPVLDAPTDMYVQTHVIVPLIKEVLDNYQLPIMLKEVSVTDPVALPADIRKVEAEVKQ